MKPAYSFAEEWADYMTKNKRARQSYIDLPISSVAVPSAGPRTCNRDDCTRRTYSLHGTCRTCKAKEARREKRRRTAA